MKIPKFQFRLATIFVALTLCGMVMAVYRHYVHIDERIRYHRVRQGSSASSGMLSSLQVFQESREALVAGDEDRLDALGSSYRFGQPLEIGYVPAQLAALDQAISDMKAGEEEGELVKNYHAQMVAEYEKSRWRPWHRVDESAGPPPTHFRAVTGPPPPLLGQ